MTAYIQRAYHGEQDLDLMVELLLARPASRRGDFPSVIDLHELMDQTNVRDATRLWQDSSGRLASFAFVDAYNNLRFEIATWAQNSNVDEEIVAWGMETMTRRAEAGNEWPGEPVTLDASCPEGDVERIAFLERHGFQRLTLRSLHYLRSLSEPIPEARLPQGYRIRPVSGEQEAEALVALHRAAFASDHLTLEERLSWMRVPGYDPELDLVVVAPDGALAGYCYVFVSQEENARSGRNEGWTDPVAVHPDHQRRGLGRALMLTGLRLLAERGVEQAAVGTSSENLAMQRLAASVGFRLESTTAWFSKAVIGNRDADQ
ncbi:MAG: GNAT family N-acetyltransferase [Anaerolineales bacterium]|nr:GNAT family N-acetyltransferase [Anaerolineales bacterium]